MTVTCEDITCADISNACQLESDAIDDVSNLSSNEPPTKAVSHENTPDDLDIISCEDISNAHQLESDAMDDVSNLSSNEPPTKAVSHENTPDDLDMFSCEDISNARQLESDAMDDVSNLSSNEPPTKAVSHENTPNPQSNTLINEESFLNCVLNKSFPLGTLLLSVKNININAENIYSLRDNSFVDDSCLDAICNLLINKKRKDYIQPSVSAVFFHSELRSLSEMQEMIPIKRNKDTVYIPLCISNHWILVILKPKLKQWTLMDPLILDGTKSVHFGKIHSQLTSNYMEKHTNQKWIHINIPHELQNDSSSCGIHIIKYMFSLNGKEDLKNLSIKESRRHLIKLLYKSGGVNGNLCAYCGLKNPINVKENLITWTKCDSCNRWVHDICEKKKSGRVPEPDINFECLICCCLKVPLVTSEMPVFTVPKIKKLLVPKDNSLTIAEMQALDDAPLEVITLEKVRAKTCRGCKKDLLQTYKSAKDVPMRPTIGLRKPYGRTIYVPKTGKQKNVKNYIYLHSKKSCLQKIKIPNEIYSGDDFSLKPSEKKDILSNKQECKRFEREFIAIEEIPVQYRK